MCELGGGSGEGDSVHRNDIITAAETILKEKNSLVTKIEYISIASPYDMHELDYVDKKIGCIISSAVRLGSVRLIDNICYGLE